jgi:hypothetical protein
LTSGQFLFNDDFRFGCKETLNFKNVNEMDLLNFRNVNEMKDIAELQVVSLALTAI